MVPAGVLLQGALFGCLNALLALAVVLLYRTGSYLSFAHGQLGAFAAALGVALSQFYGLPIGVGLSAGVCAAVIVAVASERIVVRRLITSSATLVTVATIGLAQLYAALTLLVPKVFDRDLSSNVTTGLGPRFSVSPVEFDGSSVLTVLAVVLAAAGLGLLWRTDVGLTLRALACNPDRARSFGLPVALASATAWGVSGLLAGVSGVLTAVSPSGGFGFGTVQGPAFMLRAFAAAAVGGMTNLRVTVVAAVLIGAGEHSVLHVTGNSGARDVALLVVVLVALGVRRTAWSRRAVAWQPSGLESVARLRRVPPRLARTQRFRGVTAAATLVAVTALVLLPAVTTVSQLDLATYTVLAAVAALSLTVLTGYGGVLSLGQWGLVALGAVVGAKAVSEGLDFGLGMLLAAALGASAAVLVGLPAGRLGAVFFGVSTFALAVAMHTWVVPSSVLELDDPFLVRPLLFSVFDLTSPTAYYEFSLVVLLVVASVVAWCRRSVVGLRLLAVRDNARAATALGMSVARVRVLTFAATGGLAALAGFLLAFGQEQIVPASFDPVLSLDLFLVVAIGGFTSVVGVLGAAVYVFLARYHLDAALRPLATGGGLVVLLLVLPGGLGDLFGRLSSWLATALSPKSQGEAAKPPERTRVPTSAADALLDVRGLVAGFGGAAVLGGVDVVVREGEIVALVGPNGGGKSTTAGAICGVVPVMRGHIHLAGRDVTRHSARDRVRHGLFFVPGSGAVFPDLTVAEHVRLVGVVRDGRAGAHVLDAFPALGGREEQRAGTLSGGEQQMLALAVALAVEPRLLVLDDASLGLAPAAVADLARTLSAVAARGITLLVVEQAGTAVATIATRTVAMASGRVVV